MLLSAFAEAAEAAKEGAADKAVEDEQSLW